MFWRLSVSFGKSKKSAYDNKVEIGISKQELLKRLREEKLRRENLRNKIDNVDEQGAALELPNLDELPSSELKNENEGSGISDKLSTDRDNENAAKSEIAGLGISSEESRDNDDIVSAEKMTELELQGELKNDFKTEVTITDDARDDSEEKNIDEFNKDEFNNVETSDDDFSSGKSEQTVEDSDHEDNSEYESDSESAGERVSESASEDEDADKDEEKELSGLKEKIAGLWTAAKASSPKREKNDGVSADNKKEYDENELVEWDNKFDWSSIPKYIWIISALLVSSIAIFIVVTQYTLHQGNSRLSNFNVRSINDSEYIEEDDELSYDIDMNAASFISFEEYEADNFISNVPKSSEEEKEEDKSTASDSESSDKKPEYSLKGKGSEEDPYLISSANDLVYISEQIEARSRKDQFRQAYFKQTADIAINDFTADSIDKVYSGEERAKYNWKPIGSSSKPFAGHYDGDGHKISGLYYELDASNSGRTVFAGLFAAINNAEIKNITIESAVMLAKGHKAVGILAGLASNASTIDNVKINGLVESDGVAAGFIGKVLGQMTNVRAAKLEFSGKVSSLNSETSKIEDESEFDETDSEDDTYGNGSSEDVKKDRLHLAAAFAAEAEGLDLTEFKNSGDIYSVGTAAGAIANLAISSEQNVSKLENNGIIYAWGDAAGLIGSIDSSATYRLKLADSVNRGEVRANNRAAGVVSTISLYESNEQASNLELNNNRNEAEIRATKSAGIASRVLISDGQYLTVNGNTNAAKIVGRKLASAIVADFSSVGGFATIISNVNEDSGHISTVLTDGRFLHGISSGLISRLTFNVNEVYSGMRIVNNRNYGQVSSAKTAAALIGESSLRINAGELKDEDKLRLEIGQNINFGQIKNAHYISGLIGPFDILSGQNYFDELRKKNKPLVVIRDNAVYGSLKNEIYESKNYMVGLYFGPKLSFSARAAETEYLQADNDSLVGTRESKDNLVRYINGDRFLAKTTVETKGLGESDLEASREREELIAELEGRNESGRGETAESEKRELETGEIGTEELRRSDESEESVVTESVSEDVDIETSVDETDVSNGISYGTELENIGNSKDNSIIYIINNLFGGSFEIEDSELRGDRSVDSELLRNLRTQTVALAKITDYMYFEYNYALPVRNHFINFNFVTAYQYPRMLSFGNETSFNIKDATVVPGNKVHKKESYTGFDFDRAWTMDSKTELPVPLQ